MIQKCSINEKRRIYRVIYDAINRESGTMSISKMLDEAAASERRRCSSEAAFACYNQ